MLGIEELICLHSGAWVLCYLGWSIGAWQTIIYIPKQKAKGMLWKKSAPRK